MFSRSHRRPGKDGGQAWWSWSLRQRWVQALGFHSQIDCCYVVIFQDVDLDKEALENLLDMVEEMKKRATSKSQLSSNFIMFDTKGKLWWTCLGKLAKWRKGKSWTHHLPQTWTTWRDPTMTWCQHTRTRHIQLERISWLLIPHLQCSLVTSNQAEAKVPNKVILKIIHFIYV